jgi:hypothetical protein
MMLLLTVVIERILIAELLGNRSVGQSGDEAHCVTADTGLHSVRLHARPGRSHPGCNGIATGF